MGASGDRRWLEHFKDRDINIDDQQRKGRKPTFSYLYLVYTIYSTARAGDALSHVTRPYTTVRKINGKCAQISKHSVTCS